jgi:hypothetical protein
MTSAPRLASRKRPPLVLKEYGVADAVEQVAITVLGPGLGLATGKPVIPFAQGALDGRRQTDQIVLADDVPHPRFDEVDRRFLANAAGHQNHRQVGMMRPDVNQDLVKGQAVRVEVRQDDVPSHPPSGRPSLPARWKLGGNGPAGRVDEANAGWRENPPRQLR